MGMTNRLLPQSIRANDSGFVPRPGTFAGRTWLLAACLAGSSAGNVFADGPASDLGRAEAPQVASRSSERSTADSLKPGSVTSTAESDVEAIARANQALADCREKFKAVRDYTCTLVKRERIEGRLTPQHVMQMKARSNPTSIYFKFKTPNKGREAIYVAGKNGGKVVAHDVGIGKFLAGTMNLDPRGSMAMEDCRHPITEAGIGALIETVAGYWKTELTPGESQVRFHSMRIGSRGCTMIETVHPAKQRQFLYHKVLLYVDEENGLPIRFEAFDWPKRPGAAPELLEEYTYLDLRTNVGLTEQDFNPDNRSYSYGRF